MEPGYFVHRPGPPLAAYIDHFWLLEDYPAPRLEKLLPDGGLEFILNLGEPQFLHDVHDPGKFREYRESWVSGQRSQAILIGCPWRANHIGVRFRILGAHAFLHLPLLEIQDRVIDAVAICGPDVRGLRERIAAAPNPAAKFQIFETYLLGRLRSPVRHERQITFAVAAISAAHSEDTIERVARRAGLGNKQFRRLFQSLVGLSPKTLYRVCRLQRILNQIEQTPDPNWARLAQQCGFFDQSHFNREFKSFVALTPTEYLASRGPYLNYLPVEAAAERAVA